MDKILLTAFLSALAGFITAILSIVKLINDKESKTTDYRQSWTDSVRASLAGLISRINALAGILLSLGNNRELFTRVHTRNQADNNRNIKSPISDLSEKVLKDTLDARRETRREIYEYYALTRLHFKPNDLSFNRIEQKFDAVMSLLDEMKMTESKEKRIELKEKIHGMANEIANYARDILKTEWETVKTGEPAYKKTKKWSIISSIIMFFILITIGVHAFLASAQP